MADDRGRRKVCRTDFLVSCSARPKLRETAVRTAGLSLGPLTVKTGSLSPGGVTFAASSGVIRGVCSPPSSLADGLLFSTPRDTDDVPDLLPKRTDRRVAAAETLLTGATGMVGSQCLWRLVRRGEPVSVLVRGDDQRAAEARVADVLDAFGGSLEDANVRVVVGDLNDPGSLAKIGRVARVIHCGASVTFRSAETSVDGEPYRTNNDGLRNLVDACRRWGTREFHHVSTAYVCGLRDGVVREDDVPAEGPFANDYEDSKAIGERMVTAAAEDPSHPIDSLTIYRPSIVHDPGRRSPLRGAQTIYGAYSLYELLLSKAGHPPAVGEEPARWFGVLGLGGDERKNLVAADWVGRVIDGIVADRSLHRRTYHLTAPVGTPVRTIEDGYALAAEAKGVRPPAGVDPNELSIEWLLKLAEPYFGHLEGYFRDDPTFGRSNLVEALEATGIEDCRPADASEIAAGLGAGVARFARNGTAGGAIRGSMDAGGAVHAVTASMAESEGGSGFADVPLLAKRATSEGDSSGGDDDIVLLGCDVRLAGADGLAAFEELLFEGRDATGTLPPHRLDAGLYFDPEKGRVGKTYTRAGGWVDQDPVDVDDGPERYDRVHRHFADVATRCWAKTFGGDAEELRRRTGVFVGHSGGTEAGGRLALAELADEVGREVFGEGADAAELTRRLRDTRPDRGRDRPRFYAYAAASLAAKRLRLGGVREVVDAACASSLVALSHAATAIRGGRIDAAVVGGATYNNEDNLILFSHSQACAESVSRPFDADASGLVSAEGYVAVIVARRSVARALGVRPLATLAGVGVASDGRGKSLWAPRTEGQQLAIRRGYDGEPLSIDYLEAHATSTPLGDATELKTLHAVASEAGRDRPLRVGSVKSNLGHTLEAAGLIGLTKVMIAMRRGEIPPSINIDRVTEQFAWDGSLVEVVRETSPWTGDRRAGVDAFGIGGLNAHAVVDQSRGSVGTATAFEAGPVAITGRGVVVAGALNVEAFEKSAAGGRSAVGPPPDDRTLSPDAPAGGYVRGFTFNGQPYRIPPKQVKHANPAQMMLIDAVEQAIGQRDGGTWDVDRSRVGVVIGSVFGGDFGDELQIGLRIPEIVREAVGIDGSVDAEGLSDRLLKKYPAILDETGSFTASTLASRIAKTFDLMGGAAAVDADEASSALALMLAVDQLNAGKLDAVVCGTTARAMDIASRAARPGVTPGEGVAVVVLERSADAEAAGRKVFGIIDGVVSSETAAAGGVGHDDDLVRRHGYLAGADLLLRIIDQTVRWRSSPPRDTAVTIPSRAVDGWGLTVELRPPPDIVVSDRPSAPSSESLPTAPSMSAPVLLNRSPRSVAAATGGRSLWIDGGSADEIRARLDAGGWSTERSAGSAWSVGLLPGGDRDAAAAAVGRCLDQGARRRVLPKVGAVFCRRDHRDRIGWVFPGQGSQYAAVPAVFGDPAAVEFLKRFEACLPVGEATPLLDRLSDPDGKLGGDPWWTQLWVLAVGGAMADALRRRGHRPDVVMGHSFGECTAAWDAGVMDAAAAVKFARLRSDAVSATVPGGGRLLSVAAGVGAVREVLDRRRLACVVSHQNSPVQTVVAGPSADIDAAAEAFKAEGLPAVVIAVPAAFHTAAMRPAESILRRNFAGTPMRVPACGFLSAIGTGYLAEPGDVLESLVGQLTRPVLYATAARRMVDDGCGLLIEVGPGGVLTKLNAASVGDDALWVSADERGGGSLALVDLAVECFEGRGVARAEVEGGGKRGGVSRSSGAEVTGAEDAVEVIDLTGGGGLRTVGVLGSGSIL